MRSLSRLTTALCTALLVASGCAPGSGESGGQNASNYPAKEIALHVVYPAGSAPDTTARTIAAELEKTLGQKVVVVNKAGGNGLVGLTELTSQPADGYTIGFTASPPLVTSWQLVESGFTGPEAITPIAQTNEVPSVLFVNRQSGITTIDEFLAAARSGKVKVGVPGAASVQRFQLEEFLTAAGIKVEQVITDAGQQVLSTVNGTYDAGVAQPSPILQHVKKGDLRMIGYFGSKKPEGLDVPTFNDAGYKITFGGFEGFVGPKGLPKDIVEKLNTAIQKAVTGEAFISFAKNTSGVPAYQGADLLSARIKEDVQTSKQFIDKLKLAK